MKENKASITITASPHEVWQVLTDLPSFEEWNPMFVEAKGTIAVGQSLNIKMKLPVRIMCGAPLSYSWSPSIIRVEPNSCLEWFAPAGIKGFIDGTHYFQLVSSHGGTVTEFTQGERYEGWGTGLYASSGTMEDARRGFVAMNQALQIETIRRQGLQKSQAIDTHLDSEQQVAELDISDPVAVAAMTAAAAATTNTPSSPPLSPSPSPPSPPRHSVEATSAAAAAATIPTPRQETDASHEATPVEKVIDPSNKRVSMIGAGLTSFFTSSKSSSPVSPAKDGEKEAQEEDGDDDEGEEEDASPHDDQEEDEPAEDPVAKKEREAKNAERIELDLGSGELSLAEFGL